VFDAVNAVLYNNMLLVPLPDGGTVDNKNVIHMGAINAVAGVITAVVDYPLDVLKTNIQVGTCGRLTASSPTPTTFQAAKAVVARYYAVLTADIVF
jgi:hypothetical protein